MTQVAIQYTAGPSLHADMQVQAFSSVLPQAVAADLQGAGVDTKDYEAAGILIHAGVCTDGNYTITLEHSHTNGSFVAATGALETTPTVITPTADEFIQYIRILPSAQLRRWLSVQVTESSAGSTGVIMSASIVLGKPRRQPV